MAVQNAAPRQHMGAATASTQFFRSIGSTMGVAVFGSILLTIYHRDFADGVPAGTPPMALQLFSNPLMLPQMRDQLIAAFSYPGGLLTLRSLVANVRSSLVHGLQVIFFVGAVIMVAAVLLNAMLREVPLRGRAGHSEPPV